MSTCSAPPIYLGTKNMNFPRKQFVFEPFKVTEVKCRGTEVPRPRSGHRISCDDVNLYCFGGYNPNPELPITSAPGDNPTWSPARPLFRELWSFCIATRKWKLHKVVENMPEELASNAMCMNGRYLMIFGGTGAPFGNKCNNDVIVWRTGPGDVKFQILEVKEGTKPPGLYGQSILCYDGHFYSIGGTNGYLYSCDIFRLDLQTLKWQTEFVGTGQDGEPIGRYRHEVARVGDKLYIIGGGTGEWAFELMEIPMFDLQSKTWSILIPKADDSLRETLGPLPRKCHSAVQIDTPNGVQVFVAGGSDGQSIFDDVWRFNVSSLQWTLMQKTVLPNPLYFHSSTVTSTGCMYVFGGIEPKEQASSRNNILYKVWLCIPKLSEICWEALLHYHPDMDQMDKLSLLNIGVPRHFVDRLYPFQS